MNGQEIRYITVPVTRGDITQIISASGKLAPGKLVDVGAQVSGQVKQIYTGVNQLVKKGELMAEIDPELALTQLKQSTANMEIARVNYEQSLRDLKRTRILLDKQYVAKINMEQAEVGFLNAKNNYESAKSAVERDKTNLGYTKIYAPIDGLVVTQEVQIGQTLNASTSTPKLFTVAGDLENMKIVTNFSESEIGKIKVGMSVDFSVDAYADKKFSGSVESVNLYPMPGQQVSGYTAVLAVNNEEKLLYQGMTAYISIVLLEKKDVLRVPLSAMRFVPPPEKESGIRQLLQNMSGIVPPDNAPADETRKVIYILRSGRPVPVEFTPGLNDLSNIEVTGADIKEGDEIITGIEIPQED